MALLSFFMMLRCPNLAVKEAEDDEIVEEEDVVVDKARRDANTKKKRQTQGKLEWIGEPVQVCLLALSIFPNLSCEATHSL